ncbi:MAG: LysR family transcriptional regulator, partial [Solirubrobacterales bacterium]|nr:LysR family transcriptional regulator [Solirubrobacterales bacterium]
MGELTLQGLRVLREVARRGSFSAAADALDYTQSAVSRQVATLEAAAGAPLFERAARGVRPTEAGRLLLGRAEAILDEVDGAHRDLAAARDAARGLVRLGAFPTAIAALVPRTMALAAQRHPEIEVRLREGTTPAQLRRLVRGEVDLAVLGALADTPGLTSAPLLEDPMLVAVGRGHPLAGRRQVALDALAGEAWIAGAGDVTSTLAAELDFHPPVRFAVREWTAKLGLVAAGLGVTLVPALAAPAIRDDVALVRIDGPPAAARTVHLARRDAAPPQADVVAAVLHE